MVTRRQFLMAAGATALAAPSLLRAIGPEEVEHSQAKQAYCAYSGKRPNVILILCDDLGWGDLGAFWQNSRNSTTKIQTPNIDTAICEGVMMTEAYTTSPVCVPARASMVTGKHQGHCSLRSNKFDCPIDTTMTIGTVMQQAGYSTWHIGKWGIGGGYQSADGENCGRRSMACAAGFDYSYGYPAHGHGHSFYHWEGKNTDGTTAHDWQTSKGGSPIIENVSKEVYAQEEAHWLRCLSQPATSLGLAEDAFLVDSGDGTESGLGVYYRRLIADEEVRYCYDTDLFTAKIKQLINGQLQHEPGKPFFCYACYTTVHGAGSTNDQGDPTLKSVNNFHVPGRAYPALTPEDTVWGGGVTWEKDAQGHLSFKELDTDGNNTSNTWAYADDEAGWTNDATTYNAKQRYATNVRRLDDALGDLRHFLEVKGIAGDTLILFTSDNGPALEYLAGANNWNSLGYTSDWFSDAGIDSNGPFQGKKRWVYEGGMREPTFAVWPGVIPSGEGETPRTVEHPFQFPAWMATLADVAGLPQPARCDGVSILPALTGSGRQLPARIYSEYASSDRGWSQMVRDGDFVLLYENGTPTALKLFNVKEDPAQEHDLSAEPSYADRVRYMKDLFVSCRLPLGKTTAATGTLRAYGQSPDWLNNSAMPATPCPGKQLPKWQGKLFFQGAATWPWVPNFRTLLPEAAFAAADKSAIEAELAKVTAEAYGLSLRGWIEVDAEKEVTFTASGAGGCHVWLHEAHIIDREAGNCQAVTITMKLAKGRHPIKLYLTQKADAARCSVAMDGVALV